MSQCWPASLEEGTLRAVDQLLTSNNKKRRFTKTPFLLASLTPAPVRTTLSGDHQRTLPGAQKTVGTSQGSQPVGGPREQLLLREAPQPPPVPCPETRRAWHTTFCNFFFIIFFKFSFLFF